MDWNVFMTSRAALPVPSANVGSEVAADREPERPVRHAAVGRREARLQPIELVAGLRVDRGRALRADAGKEQRPEQKANHRDLALELRAARNAKTRAITAIVARVRVA